MNSAGVLSSSNVLVIVFIAGIDGNAPKLLRIAREAMLFILVRFVVS